MKRLKKSGNNELIEKLVDRVIKVYYEEDYDYAVEEAKNGRRTVGIDTIEEEVAFIKNNDLNTDNLDDEDLAIAAERILGGIKQIDEEIYRKYKI